MLPGWTAVRTDAGALARIHLGRIRLPYGSIAQGRHEDMFQTLQEHTVRSLQLDCCARPVGGAPGLGSLGLGSGESCRGEGKGEDEGTADLTAGHKSPSCGSRHGPPQATAPAGQGPKPLIAMVLCLK